LAPGQRWAQEGSAEYCCARHVGLGNTHACKKNCSGLCHFLDQATEENKGMPFHRRLALLDPSNSLVLKKRNRHIIRW
jgi:hypothetical protein